MNHRLQYELRGLAYWAECANPWRSTVTARNLPLGLRIQGYKRDAVGRGLYRRGVHEPGLTRFLLEKFSNAQASNFLDIGANIGYFSCLLGKLAGTSGKVISIEAEPQNYQLLERNLRNNRLTNVTALQCAVGASKGTAKIGIYKNANRGRHSLVDLENCKNVFDIPVRRLDDVVREAGVKSWTFAKIDVEGYEPLVFAGGPETLACTEMLAMEYSPAHWRKAGFEPDSVLQKLAAHFPRLYRFQETELVETSIEECVRREVILDLLLQR